MKINWVSLPSFFTLFLSYFSSISNSHPFDHELNSIRILILSVCRSVWLLSICLFAYLPVCLSVCLSVYLSVWPSYLSSSPKLQIIDSPGIASNLSSSQQKELEDMYVHFREKTLIQKAREYVLGKREGLTRTISLVQPTRWEQCESL